MKKEFLIESNLSVKKYGYDLRKSFFRKAYDFLGFPVICLLPYKWIQFLGFTDLGRERRRAVIPYLKGKILDVGWGPLNQLKDEYKDSQNIINLDVFQWGNVDIVSSAEKMPIEDNQFDTVLMLACLNHIPDKQAAVNEAYRVLKKNGKIVITMINPFIGYISHKLCSWFDYDHVRGMYEDENMGLTVKFIKDVFEKSGFKGIKIKKFLYGLNQVFIAEK